MRVVAALSAALAVGGCAVATTGVVPRSEGLNTVTRQGSSFLVQPMELTAAASREAQAYCAQANKQAKIVHTKEIPAGPLGRWPESEVLFRCE